MSNREQQARSVVASGVAEAAVSLDAATVARVLRALSNPNRLKMFMLLREARLSNGKPKGMRVGEIAEQLEVTQSTVSHHLRELEHAGLVRLDRSGKAVYCSILLQPLTDVLESLECTPEG